MKAPDRKQHILLPAGIDQSTSSKLGLAQALHSQPDGGAHTSPSVVAFC
jgi:hypothetical protein